MPGFPVDVVNGLGAGDAFAAALGHGAAAGAPARRGRAARHGRGRDRRLAARLLRRDAAARRARGGARYERAAARAPGSGRRSRRSRPAGATSPSASGAGAVRVARRRTSRSRSSPLSGRCRVEARGRALGARRPRSTCSPGCRGRSTCRATPPTASRATASVAVCGARCERRREPVLVRAGRRRGRGARRGQRDPADQPHPQAGVPGRAAARRRGLHAVRQLVELPAAQARRGPTRRARSCSRRRTTSARARPEAFAVQRLYSPRHGARRHGDRARRRPDARAVRLPHDRRRARLRPLLPERARGRPPLDGRPPTIPTSPGSAARGRTSSRIRACRSSGDPRRERTGQLRRVRADGRRAAERARGPRGARRDRRGRLRGNRARPARLPRHRRRAARAPRRRGLALAGAFVELDFGDGDLADARGDARRARRRTMRSRCSPTRARATATSTSTASRAPSSSRAGAGFEPTFHHHMGTRVQTPAEIERLLEGTDVGAPARHRAPERGGRRPGAGTARLALAHRPRAPQGRATRRPRALRATGTTPGATGRSASSARATSTCEASSPGSTATTAGSSSSRTGSPGPATRSPRRSRRRPATGAGWPTTRVSEADRGHGGP